MMDKSPDIVAEMYAPPGRRWMGIGMLYALGGLLVVLAVFQPPQSAIWLIFLLGTGLISLWGAEKMRQATAHGIRLTDDALWETGGRRIINLDDIEDIDRGVFAFKPSNGFLIKAKIKLDRSWRPGLYWVLGRRIGIGGVTSRAQAKMLADAIALILAERRAGQSSD